MTQRLQSRDEEGAKNGVVCERSRTLTASSLRAEAASPVKITGEVSGPNAPSAVIAVAAEPNPLTPFP